MRNIENDTDLLKSAIFRFFKLHRIQRKPRSWMIYNQKRKNSNYLCFIDFLKSWKCHMFHHRRNIKLFRLWNHNCLTTQISLISFIDNNVCLSIMFTKLGNRKKYIVVFNLCFITLFVYIKSKFKFKNSIKLSSLEICHSSYNKNMILHIQNESVYGTWQFSVKLKLSMNIFISKLFSISNTLLKISC